ncbi:MAG: RecX family transcriptional regulator [Erysipelotrichaceae bacterium]|nr:RecX family transcriptional regulator [Erysipelotrichaceae bacterium]
MDINSLLKTNKIEIADYKYKIIKIKDCNNYFIIYLDNGDKLKISIETYCKYTNLKGLDEDTYQLFNEENNYVSAYNSCLRKLSIKDYSKKQLYDYLKTKFKLDVNQIDNILNKLIQYNLIDDNRYCINRINYLNSSLYSYKNIKAKLLKEGITEDIINTNLSLDKDNELNKAIQLANKYIRTINNKSFYAKKQSIMNKLVSNGYNYDIVNDVVDKLEFTIDNEEELLKKQYSKAYSKYSKKYSDYDLSKRIISSLLSKGFKIEDIKKVMEVQDAS